MLASGHDDDDDKVINFFAKDNSLHVNMKSWLELERGYFKGGIDKFALSLRGFHFKTEKDIIWYF